MRFYGTDQGRDGWRRIGAEGKEIATLTNNERDSDIYQYAYIPGMGEFLLNLEEYREYGKFRGRWTVRLIDYDTVAIVRHNEKEVASVPWQETLQHYSRGGVFERMTGTKHKGFKLHKRETPYNYIRLIIGTMLKLKKEGNKT